MTNIIVTNQSGVINSTKTPPYFRNKNVLVYNEDFLKITAIPKSCVDLIITSPPYNVDIHYNSHADNLSYVDYLEFAKNGSPNVTS